MTTKKEYKRALKEATTDTLLALIINFPLNVLLLYVAANMELTIFWTSCFMTAIFTNIAIVRKTIVRVHFKKKYE